MRIRCRAGKTAALGFAASMFMASTFAGDHHDGEGVESDGKGDISGLYAFVPSIGGEPGPLALFMGVRPFAIGMIEVGKDVEYNFRIRAAGLSGTGGNVHSIVSNDEVRLMCYFYSGKHEVNCELLSSDGTLLTEVRGPLNATIRNRAGTLRIMAGLRADPYMTNVHAVRHCLDHGEREFREGDGEPIHNNWVASKANVIGISAEIDQSLLPRERGMPLIAVAAETIEVGSDGSRRRIDRAGRPEMSTALIADDDSRDAWNAQDPFDPRGMEQFRDVVQRGLMAVDALSDMNRWDYPHPLLDLVLRDYLLLNPAKPVAPVDTEVNHYFELEWAAYKGEDPSAVAGGRRLMDNSVAKFYSVFARQGRSPVAHLESLEQALYRLPHARMPYAAAPFQRLELLSNRIYLEIKELPNFYVGCR